MQILSLSEGNNNEELRIYDIENTNIDEIPNILVKLNNYINEFEKLLKSYNVENLFNSLSSLNDNDKINKINYEMNNYNKINNDLSYVKNLYKSFLEKKDLLESQKIIESIKQKEGDSNIDKIVNDFYNKAKNTKGHSFSSYIDDMKNFRNRNYEEGTVWYLSNSEKDIDLFISFLPYHHKNYFNKAIIKELILGNEINIGNVRIKLYDKKIIDKRNNEGVNYFYIDNSGTLIDLKRNKIEVTNRKYEISEGSFYH